MKNSKRRINHILFCFCKFVRCSIFPTLRILSKLKFYLVVWRAQEVRWTWASISFRWGTFSEVERVIKGPLRRSVPPDTLDGVRHSSLPPDSLPNRRCSSCWWRVGKLGRPCPPLVIDSNDESIRWRSESELCNELTLAPPPELSSPINCRRRITSMDRNAAAEAAEAVGTEIAVAPAVDWKWPDPRPESCDPLWSTSPKGRMKGLGIELAAETGTAALTELRLLKLEGELGEW